MSSDRRGHRDEVQKYITPTLRAWMTRVGAVQISLKKFVVKTEDEGGYPSTGPRRSSPPTASSWQTRPSSRRGRRRRPSRPR